ncbi:MAG TPA: hypothetical protein VM733_19805 [Thermoanaerobaculia bacterium]|nr:hypothetical protein [Thermoanaerobaculia bacterium]
MLLRMPSTPPRGRMVFAALIASFFGAFAAASIHSAKQEYRWRNATPVHGVLVKNGSAYHYEYRPKGEPAVVGPLVSGESSDKPDGVVDDWARLDYDPNLPELFRRRSGRGRAATNYGQFKFAAGAGAVFSLIVLAAIWSFLKAAYDSRN